MHLLKEKGYFSLKVPILNVTIQAVNFTATQGKNAAFFQAFTAKAVNCTAKPVVHPHKERRQMSLNQCLALPHH